MVGLLCYRCFVIVIGFVFDIVIVVIVVVTVM